MSKKKAFDKNANSIPPLISCTIEYIRKYGIMVEGIFRLSGVQSKILELKKRFDKGKPVILTEQDDIHVATGVLKLYFREMKDPLLTYALYDSLIEAMRKPEEEQEGCISQLIGLLPQGNKLILETVLKLLREIEKEKDTNKMNVSNLAIIFAPSFLKPKGVDNPLELMSNIQTQQRIVEFLITHSEKLFSPNLSNVQKKIDDPRWQQTLRRASIMLTVETLEEEENEESNGSRPNNEKFVKSSSLSEIPFEESMSDQSDSYEGSSNEYLSKTPRPNSFNQKLPGDEKSLEGKKLNKHNSLTQPFTGGYEPSLSASTNSAPNYPVPSSPQTALNHSTPNIKTNFSPTNSSFNNLSIPPSNPPPSHPPSPPPSNPNPKNPTPSKFRNGPPTKDKEKYSSIRFSTTPQNQQNNVKNKLNDLFVVPSCPPVKKDSKDLSLSVKKESKEIKEPPKKEIKKEVKPKKEDEKSKKEDKEKEKLKIKPKKEKKEKKDSKDKENNKEKKLENTPNTPIKSSMRKDLLISSKPKTPEELVDLVLKGKIIEVKKYFLSLSPEERLKQKKVFTQMLEKDVNMKINI